MSESRKQPSYARLTDYLESMITAGSYKTGDRLPPLRQLAAEFGLNLDTTRRGIWHLRDKGLLECRRGDGVYVNGHRHSSGGREKIALLALMDRPCATYVGHVMQGIQEEAQELGITLEIHPTSYHAIPREQVLSVVNRSDGLLILGTFDLWMKEILFPIPVVGVEMHRNYGGAVSTISLDPVRAAELAGDFFRSRKIRHVAIWSNRTPLHDFRAERFLENWTAGGGEARFRHVEDRGIVLHDDPAIGYFFTGGSCANDFAVCYHTRTGRTLIEDYAAVALDGKSFLVPGFEPMNNIYPEWTETGKIALHELLRRIRIPGASSLRLYCDVKYQPAT